MDLPKTFRFADLELDQGRQRVTRDGIEVPLPKLSFDLLFALAEAAPNVVSNRELMARVWPGLVVADKTVSQRVKLLRDALGDDLEQPRYVASLRGRGYRIAAEVVRVDPSAAVVTADEPGTARAVHDEAAIPRRILHARWLIPTVALATVVAWWLLAGTPGLFAGADRASVAPAIARQGITVAVLPFRNLGTSDVDAYVALGIPEMVLDQLAAVPGFTVIARSSSFEAARRNLGVQETGRRLGVRYLIDGSVQRTGDTLRLSVQLLDASAGTQIWAERFDRDIADIFAVQDEIAARVVGTLRARSDPQQAMPDRSRPTNNIDAYLAYLRGRTLLPRWTAVDAAAAAQAFELAISLDPHFAAAYASLYDARLMEEDRRTGSAVANLAQYVNPANGESFRHVREANATLIDQALAIDPQCGAAYFARAIWADDASGTRESDFRRGLELDPSNGRGITAFAEFLDRSGRPDEAAQMLELAIDIDPLSPRAYFIRVMRGVPSSTEELEAGILEVLEIDPDYQPALQRYAKYRWMFHGELARSIQLIEHALEHDPGNAWLLHTAIAMYLDIGDPETANALLARAGRPDISGRLLVLLYDRDRRGAGEAALRDSAFANGLYENWGVYEALRDWAIDSGDYRRALEQIDRHTALGAAVPEIRLNNFRAVPEFAQLEIAAGDTEAGRALLESGLRWIDEYHLPRRGRVYALRVKANIQLLLGERDEALDTLRTSFAANDYLQSWYTIEQDPLWLPLHGDPRFEAIAATVRAHVAGEAVALEDLRRQGLVPRRSTAASAPGTDVGNPQ